MFNSIAVIGLGLIGASLVHDIHQHRLADRIIGLDNNPLAGEALNAHELLAGFYTKIAEVPGPVDMVIISTPPKFFDEVARKLGPLLKEGTIVMDIGSVKQSAIETIAPHIPDTALYVPAHPITGSEKSGPGAGEKNLFANRRNILTPLEDTPPAALDLAIHFWEKLGAVCEVMSAKRHDVIYAYMSHLPHLVAYGCAGTLAHYCKKLPYSLTPFLRIAGSNPELWCDIATANHSAINEAMEFYLTVLNHMIAELKAGAEQGESSTGSEKEVAEVLFPRIAASCLISAVTLCEKREELSLARYAGRGFADLTSPLQTPPEGDIERISHAHQQVTAVLTDFEARLRALAVALKEEDHDTLFKQMQDGQKAWATLSK